MPVVSIPAGALYAHLGREYTDEEFDELCFNFGLELDEITSEKELVARERGIEKATNCSLDKLLKIEVPANRYDLLCPEGLTRALLIFSLSLDVPRYKQLEVKNPVTLTVRSATQSVRPFAVAAILRNVAINETGLNSLIDLQEKLHQTVCRKRSVAAIGAHDLDTLKPPFVYDARQPRKIRFTPLNKTGIYTAEELMELYATDSHLKPYLTFIQGKPLYPVIEDSRGITLSMPPVINGEHSRVTVKTRNLFIEITATDLHKASVVLDTLVTMFSEYCEIPYTVEPVEVIQHDGSRQLFPRLEYRNEVISVDYVNRLLGTHFSEAQISHLLHRMGLIATSIVSRCPTDPNTDTRSGCLTIPSGLLSVLIPPTRHDILHACDIVEDVAIAHGYDNIPEHLPQTYCIAEIQPVNRLSDMIRTSVAEAGFTEALSFSLCSRDDVSVNLRQRCDDVPAVHISNPKTFDFQVVRTSLLPGLLHTLSHNRSLPLPLKLFEVQDVVLKDATKDVGASNHRRVCAVYYNKSSGFEVIHGLLDRLMQLLDVPWQSSPDGTNPYGDHSTTKERTVGHFYYLRATDDPTFFTGRCADVMLGSLDQVIGRIGVVHPEVLRNFDLPMPCSMLDLDLEVFV